MCTARVYVDVQRARNPYTDTYIYIFEINKKKKIGIFPTLVRICTAIEALRAKMEENKCHQRKLHQLSVQREQLQIKMLEQDIEQKTNLYSLQIQRDQEVCVISFFLLFFNLSEIRFTNYSCTKCEKSTNANCTNEDCDIKTNCTRKIVFPKQLINQYNKSIMHCIELPVVRFSFVFQF